MLCAGWQIYICTDESQKRYEGGGSMILETSKNSLDDSQCFIVLNKEESFVFFAVFLEASSSPVEAW